MDGAAVSSTGIRHRVGNREVGKPLDIITPFPCTGSFRRSRFCKPEVTGSIPVRSTCKTRVFCRNPRILTPTRRLNGRGRIQLRPCDVLGVRDEVRVMKLEHPHTRAHVARQLVQGDSGGERVRREAVTQVVSTPGG